MHLRTEVYSKTDLSDKGLQALFFLFILKEVIKEDL